MRRNSIADHDSWCGRQRGSALVLAVFVIFVLTGMGVALLFMTQTDTRMARTDLEAKRAFYAAEAGIEHARMQLFQTNGSGSFDDDLLAAAGNNGAINFDPAAIERVHKVSANGLGGATMALGFAGAVDDAPLVAATYLPTPDGADGWYAAYLTNDPADIGGIGSTDDTNDRVMLTSVSMGASGSTETIQAIIEPISLLPPLPPAAITLIGPTPVFNGGNSGAKSYSGADCGGAGDPTINVPVVGTFGPDAEASAELGISKPGKFTSGPYSGDETIADLTDPDDPIMKDLGWGLPDSTWTSCKELMTLVESLRSQATFYCDKGACGKLPATGPNSISFIAAPNVAMGPGYIGQGVLVVTGQLVFKGNASFDGLIMVVGEGKMMRSGGGNGAISGSTIVADIAGPDDKYEDPWAADNCTGGTSGFDIATYSVNGGGNSDITFCSTVLDAVNPWKTYRVVDFLQR